MATSCESSSRKAAPPTFSYWPGVFEQLGEQHWVDLPAAFVEGEHVTEDGAVGRVVEVFGADEEGDFVADFGQQEEAADEGPLGFDAARGLAIEKLADFGGGFCARLAIYRGHRFDPSVVCLISIDKSQCPAEMAGLCGKA